MNAAFEDMKAAFQDVNAAFHDWIASFHDWIASFHDQIASFHEWIASFRGRALPSLVMSRRTQAETLALIVEAFHESRTWAQAALGKRVGVESRRVKGYLDVLIKTKQFPLERSVEGRHVYWSLPKGWIAGGVTLLQDEIAELVRILARSPRSASCRLLLAKLVACSPPRAPPTVEPDTIAAPSRSEREERMLGVAESSAAAPVPLRVRYHTPSRDEVTDRTLSVQRIQAGPPARLFAWCHKSQALKTFRVDRIHGAALDPGVAFVRCDPAEVDALVAGSVDGYHGPAREPVLCRFCVRDPQARWVAFNLPEPMRGERRDALLEVTVKTAAVEQVSRFVVGLGGAAAPLTPELEAGVRALAEGALAALARGGPVPV